ncbi:MAG: CcoQ/FixQ family Cbb3-type cytochrome c oxidase assembly chaperone [Alphaproteobacteria bacterium]|nr:CcoQ/FixQ family Cbb3-type cytochrome c oxidase assembly chaperone [Alphaproteobacteria bacterium]MCW5750553.1 CcoQ/FixQ family Cbb3-type cytochrome c oxidase assembly chaperone [Alphaproteobacteria bacterium]
MELGEIYPLLRSLWTVWFTALFIGLVAWALWPSRREEMRRAARIPLDDQR